MKITLRIVVGSALFALMLAVGSVGYLLGRRDALTVDRHDALMLLSPAAMAVRADKPELALRLLDWGIEHDSLELKGYQGIPGWSAALHDTFESRYNDAAFQRTSQYIDLYPAAKISPQAVAYIQAQPDSEH